MKRNRLLSLLVLLLTAVTGAWAQTGMTNGLFSVSETKKVYFSKGNLQLVGENTFQFAENQWDYFGSNQSDNHRDLFCWGTGNTPNQTTGNSTFTDWGDNTYLQATLGKGWRTLTKDEFAYVFNTRASGSTVFGNANGRYTAATINTDGTGVKGLILFPDGITIAASEVTTAGAINGSGTLTQCTTAQWAALEEKGCVFLPAGGFILSGTGIGHGSITDYWSSTAADAIKAYNLGLNFAVPGAVVNTAGTLAYNYGLSVRLVIDGYVVTMKDGVKDADKWTVKVGEGQAYALPIGGLKGDGSETVTLQYNGRLKVKGVKATSDEQEAVLKTPATVTTAPTGAAIVGVGKTTALVSGGVADGGTLMYKVQTTKTMPPTTDGFSDAVPTAENITASGKVYVWYYVKGDATHSDSGIAATAIEVPVADIVWDITNVSDIYIDGYGELSYEKEDVTLSCSDGDIYAWWNNDGISFDKHEPGDFTFTAPTGKAFTKIEMTLTGSTGWDIADLGTGWTFSGDHVNNIYTVTWNGSAASTVDLLKGADDFSGGKVKYIAFYLSE